MEQKPLPHIRNSDIIHLCCYCWLCSHWPLCAKYAMSALSLPNFIFDHRLLTSASFMPFYSVDPSPLTPYVGCHMTQNNVIVLVSWVNFLFYNTGAESWDDVKWNLLKNTQVMLILMTIPAWRVCKLLQC